MKIVGEGDNFFVENADCVYQFSVMGTDTMTTLFSTETDMPWEQMPVTAGGFQVVPFGQSNDLPEKLRLMVEENNLAPGILRKKVQLLWGQGPELYDRRIEDGQRKKVWIEDKTIRKWLDSWDYRNYLLNLVVDFYHTEMVFSKMFRNRGARIGDRANVVKLEHINAENARFEYPGKGKRYPRRLIVGDFKYETVGLKPYTIFNPEQPLRSEVEAFWSHMYSFGRNWYNTPSYYGGRHWISRSSAIPKILKNLTDNSLNIKWHIKSPSYYWDQQRTRLEDQCKLSGTQYKESMLEDLKRQTFQSLASVMAGEENVGKFFSSEKLYDEMGNLQDWGIEPIDQKVKDFIEAQLAISKQASYSTTSAIGLHPALSNIADEAKTNSGSQQLYALKLHLATEVDIPEMIVCDAINTAIKINFPDSTARLGFYHDIVLREESIEPENRMTNVV